MLGGCVLNFNYIPLLWCVYLTFRLMQFHSLNLDIFFLTMRKSSLGRTQEVPQTSETFSWISVPTRAERIGCRLETLSYWKGISDARTLVYSSLRELRKKTCCSLEIPTSHTEETQPLKSALYLGTSKYQQFTDD